MTFYIANNLDRSLTATGVLHVSESCSRTRVPDNNRAWEATPSEVAAAYTLCGTCAPQMTALEGPADRA